MKKYKINEIFYSIQGEGINAGRAAVFIRFSGCNLKCPFCDTNHLPFEEMTCEQIVKKVMQLWPVKDTCPLVVFTGGEPTIQLDDELIMSLRKKHAFLAIETNGSYDVPKRIDYVTVSPKADFVKQAVHVKTAKEVKVVFDGKNNPEKWYETILADEYYLQPCDTGNAAQNKTIIGLLVEYVLAHPWWKISLQQQKILNVR